MTPRVLILTPYFHPVIGGVESNAARFARYLGSAGAEVRVLTKRLSRDLPDVDELDGVPIRRIGPFGDRSAAGKWLMSPAAFRWLVGHRKGYDVVCVVDYRGVGMAAIAARTMTGRRVLVQAQTPGVLSARDNPGVGPVGLSGESALARLLKWPVRAVYARADAFACISHSLEREAIAFGIPADRVHFLPNAIDMGRFRPPNPEERSGQRAALGLPPDAVVCLFVGRLSREKGVLDLVEAWNILRPPDALLLIAGPDMTGHPWDAGRPARDRIAQQGLASSVRFLGPSDAVASLLHVADVVVQPSHFEAMGLSAAEALACGVPVVASAVGGLLDFIVDGRNGLLAPPRDPRALAAALGEIIADSSLRARLGGEARASIAEYDERTVFARMTTLLASLAGERRE